MAKNSKHQSTPVSEWIIGSLGALLALAAIAYLIYDGISGDKSPPAISIRIEAIEQVNTGFRVRLRATNDGGEAAARVRIVGRLTAGTATETSETVLDYVPTRSERSGGLFFKADPRTGDLDVRATGYETP